MAGSWLTSWFSRVQPPREPRDPFVDVGERPFSVDMQLAAIVDRETGRVVQVGVVRAPEAALRFNLNPVATGANAYFLVGLAGDDSMEVGATLSITNRQRFPMRTGDRPGPVTVPRLPKAVNLVDMPSLARSFGVLRRFGYQPPRLFSDTRDSYALLQQKIFGPTFNDVFGQLQDAAGDVSIAGRGMFEEIVRAIKAAHDGGAIHCDVKPANLALLPAEERGRNGRWFGLIDVGNSVDLKDQPVRRPISRGTVPYEAPEQLQDELIYCMSEAVDVWAAGAVIAEYCAFATDLNPFLTPLNMASAAEARLLRTRHTAYREWYGAGELLEPLEKAIESLIVSQADPDEEMAAQARLQQDLSDLTPDQWRARGVVDPVSTVGGWLGGRFKPKEGATKPMAGLCTQIAELATRFPESYRNMVALSYIFTRLRLTDFELYTVVRACMNPDPTKRPTVQQLLGCFDAAVTRGPQDLPCLALDEDEKATFTACLADLPLYTKDVTDRLCTLRRVDPEHATAGTRRSLIEPQPEKEGLQ